MEKDTKEHIELALCIFACATIPKYKDQILKMNETWIKDAKNNNVRFFYFLGEEETDLQGPEYIYLPTISNDYHSASYKQNLGLKYICDNYNADFVFCCGTDTFVNIPKMLTLIKEYNPTDKLYIGGHGSKPLIHEYYHSGGAGFILSNGALCVMYPYFEKMVETWAVVCKQYENYPGIGKENFYNACDVCIAYYLSKLGCKTITRDEHFFGCNYKGQYQYQPHLAIGICCGQNIVMENIVSCHLMSLQDFDDF